MSYWVCSYHVVWATRGREPILAPEEGTAVEAIVRAAFADERVVVHAVGWMPDHVHVAASIPPALAVADVVRRWKGSSSHRINDRRRADGRGETFGWQAEYGVHTFGNAALPQVVAYVENQHERRQPDDLWPDLERAAADPPPRPVLSPAPASVP